jgi:hypothetical protein
VEVEVEISYRSMKYPLMDLKLPIPMSADQTCAILDGSTKSVRKCAASPSFVCSAAVSGGRINAASGGCTNGRSRSIAVK